MSEEAYPEAAAVLRDAGWKPHHPWAVYTRGSLIMGSPNVGEFHVKNLDAAPDSPETPDDPVAAAQWLVARFPVAVVAEPEETPAHEDDAETGAEAVVDYIVEPAVDDVSVRLSADLGSDDAFGAEGVDDAGGGDAGDEREIPDLGAEILDADFYEPTDPLIEGADFVETEDHAGGAFIFGDNLPQMRTVAIGLVVQISLAKQDAIWAEAGAGPDEYSQLMSAVVRDTVDGTYRGDQATYDRFVALSTYDNAARRVQNAERERVTMLTTADRATIESFDPQANWP